MGDYRDAETRYQSVRESDAPSEDKEAARYAMHEADTLASYLTVPSTEIVRPSPSGAYHLTAWQKHDISECARYLKAAKRGKSVAFNSYVHVRGKLFAAMDRTAYDATVTELRAYATDSDVASLPGNLVDAMRKLGISPARDAARKAA